MIIGYGKKLNGQCFFFVYFLSIEIKEYDVDVKILNF